MLSRATWRDKEKSSTLRNKSELSLMQNWAAASLMVSCGEDHQSGQNPDSPLSRPDIPTSLRHQTDEAHPSDSCLGFDIIQAFPEGRRQRSAPPDS